MPRSGPRPESRDYKQLMKDPGGLAEGLGPEQYARCLALIREEYVDPIDDAYLRKGVVEELELCLSVAEVGDTSIGQLDGLSVDRLCTKILELYGSKLNKNLLGYVTLVGLLRGLSDGDSTLMMAQTIGPRSIGKFGGLGIYIEVDKAEGLRVVEPMEDSPAAAAGLQAGDRIVRIDGKSTQGISIDAAQDRMRGDISSMVSLTIKRAGITLEVPIRRDAIRVYAATGRVVGGDISYIRLRTFGYDARGELEGVLDRLGTVHGKGLILDLRNNGGGYLTSAVDVIGEFAPTDGPILSTVGRDGQKTYHPVPSGRQPVPMVILVNEFSASASEIVAGVLRDLKLATVVGLPTLGRGTLQKSFALSSSCQLNLTVARCILPSGEAFDKLGVVPEVILPMDAKLVGRGELDVQLQKAIEILHSR